MNKSSTTPTIPGLDLGLLSSEYVEQVYALYQEDPAQVSPEWQEYFRGLQDKPSTAQPAPAATLRPLRSGVSTVVPAAAPAQPRAVRRREQCASATSTGRLDACAPASAPTAPRAIGDAAVRQRHSGRPCR